MSEQFNQLTPSEHERLAIVMEEMSEVCQVIGKILRHGYDDHSPSDKTRTTNRENLEKELGHVAYAVEQLIRHKDIAEYLVESSKQSKRSSAWQWLHHSEVL